MRPIEIRRGSTTVLIGRTGSFPASLLKAGDRQRRDAFLTNLPQERAALEQIRSEWTNVFPPAAPEQLAGAEIARTVQRGLRSGAVQVVLLRIPRMPVSPAEMRQVTSGVINAGTAQRRLLIARTGGLPPEFLAYRNSSSAIAVLGELRDDSSTARQIELQAGRLSAGGTAPLRGKPLRQNLAWQINAGALDAAVITHAPAASSAAARPDAPKAIGDMTGNERIGAALQRSLPYAIEAGGEAIRESIEDMLQPQSVLIMIGIAAAVAIANLNPISGAAVDTTLLLLAWWNGGSEAIGGVTDFAIATLDARDATTDKELDEAARAYGKALGRMGPKLLSAIVSRFLAKAGGKSAEKGSARSQAAPSKANKPASKTTASEKSSRKSAAPRPRSVLPKEVQRMPKNFQFEYSMAKARNWKKADGSPWYPPNNGAIGTPTKTGLNAGMRIDRIGSERGSFLSPANDAFQKRALPKFNANLPPSKIPPHNEYVVTPRGAKNLAVEKAEIAPWFDQPGGGTQYKLIDKSSGRTMSVEEAVANGLLFRVPK